jgi:hypothetical protein
MPFTCCLAPVVALLLQQPVGVPAPAAEPEPIADNSFLIEEAYNQDRGFVQHISLFTREWRSGAYLYSFTQEWPVDAAPAHQISYTLQVPSEGDGAGFGDIWFNWRYQSVSTDRLAIAPRVSVSAPTGDAGRGLGAGGVGLQAALPVSVREGDRFVLHSNVSGTIVPRGQDAAGDRAATGALTLGQSVVWLTSPRFNVFLEALVNRESAVTGPGTTAWDTTVVIDPAVRWAYTFHNGLQIVPGVGFPITLHGSPDERWSVLGYLSFEHPFTH